MLRLLETFATSKLKQLRRGQRAGCVTILRSPATRLAIRVELLALVGSSVFSELTGASYTQLAGFLGGGELANFGDRIANAVGLRSFSVFPTTDTASKSAVGIGIGVEASASLGKNLKASYLNVINNSNPPQLGLQYRFSEQLQLQGASNLQDIDFKLEYQIKF